MKEPKPTNINSFLCKCGVHKWVKYNLGWRRYCRRCLKIQYFGGGWYDTTYANWEGNDTEIYF